MGVMTGTAANPNFPHTNFPTNMDDQQYYAVMQDIDTDMIKQYKLYQNAIAQNNYASAHEIAAEVIPGTTKKLTDAMFDADKYNWVRDSILAMQEFFLNKFDAYLEVKKGEAADLDKYNDLSAKIDALTTQATDFSSKITTLTTRANGHDTSLSSLNTQLQTYESGSARIEQISIPTTAWSSNSCVISTNASLTSVPSGYVGGTAVIVNPAEASITPYVVANVVSTGHTANTISFKCDKVPTANLTCNLIVIPILTAIT